VTDAVMREHRSGFEPPGEDEEIVRVVVEDASLPQLVLAVSDAMARPRR
jgi:hypothetical protein